MMDRTHIPGKCQMNPDRKPASGNYWKSMKVEFFLRIPPPLRLARQDVQMYTREVGGWLGQNAEPRVLVMGATPEFHSMPWPEKTDLLAVDRSELMLRELWPGPVEKTVCEDWTNMSLENASRDIALCDGGLVMLDYPTQLTRLVEELARVLAPGGSFITRVFTSGEAAQDPASVMRDFLSGRIGNSSILKLRLAIALEPDSITGVRLHDVWKFYDRAIPARSSLSDLTGWSSDELQFMEAYENSNEIYRFWKVDELCEIFCESNGNFECTSVRTPGYELHEHMRMITFRRV